MLTGELRDRDVLEVLELEQEGENHRHDVLVQLELEHLAGEDIHREDLIVEVLDRDHLLEDLACHYRLQVVLAVPADRAQALVLPDQVRLALEVARVLLHEHVEPLLF